MNWYNNFNDSLGYGIPNFFQAYLNSLNLNVFVDDDVWIYPNPYLDGFFLKNYQEKDLKIDIFNIMGNLVFSTYINKEEGEIYINETSSFPAGIYFLQINNSINFKTLIKLYE